MNGIDFTPLGRAIELLKEGLAALKREPENTLYRDGVIQRFEFTYGLCAAMLRRYLERTADVAPEREIPFPTLIRTASEQGLVRSGWEVWHEIRKARNLTSHVYNENTALQVVGQIPMFAEEAEYLYRELEKTGTGDGN
jgi:nucleotidyltransferase substrate binding protein (TIGR01987 family)